MSNNVTITLDGARLTSSTGPEDGYGYYQIEDPNGRGIGKLEIYNFDVSSLSPGLSTSTGFPTSSFSGTTT